MSDYLARLKQIENLKNSHHLPSTEPSKAAKAPSDPFGGEALAHINKNIIESIPAMTPEEEAAIRAWMEYIEETDPETIAYFLNQCCIDLEARAYFIWRSGEVPGT